MPPPFRQAENAREKPRENTMPGKTHPAGAWRRPFLTFRTPAFKLNADFSLSGDKRAVAAQTQGGDSMRPVHLLLTVAMLTILALSAACSWVGETAGRAQAGVENAINDTRSGYHKGYHQGKQ